MVRYFDNIRVGGGVVLFLGMRVARVPNIQFFLKSKYEYILKAVKGVLRSDEGGAGFGTIKVQPKSKRKV